MSYEQRFALVRESLIKYCKERISYNWERMFDMWLSCEADMVFGDGYQNKFKEQFSEYLNSEIESKLWFAGQNIVFSICAIQMYNNDIKLDELLIFVEKFVGVQLDDFHNWCDDISSAMYEEEIQQSEDNPN